MQDDWRQRVPVLRPVVDEVAARRAGVSTTDVSAALQRVYKGENVGVYREGDDLIPIVWRSPRCSRWWWCRCSMQCCSGSGSRPRPDSVALPGR